VLAREQAAAKAAAQKLIEHLSRQAETTGDWRVRAESLLADAPAPVAIARGGPWRRCSAAPSCPALPWQRSGSGKTCPFRRGCIRCLNYMRQHRPPRRHVRSRPPPSLFNPTGANKRPHCSCHIR
jgi:hypothetical protein